VTVLEVSIGFIGGTIAFSKTILVTLWVLVGATRDHFQKTV